MPKRPGILPLIRPEKLKLFAVFAANETAVDIEALKENAILTVMLGYHDEDAAQATKLMLLEKGKDPAKYRVPVYQVAKDLEEFIGVYVDNQAKTAPPAKNKATESILSPEKKSKDTLAASVRYVFDKSATKTQKAVADKVVAKFLKADRY